MNTNKGFSLIEVLVTILLTTIGILGMVALQVKSMSYTQDTVHREAAISAANELIEIMHVHRDELFKHMPNKGNNASSYDFYIELKESTDLYANGKASFVAGSCAELPESALEAARCWLTRQQSVLPGFEITRLCPSAEPDDCPSSFKGSSLLLTLAWDSRDKSCGEEGNSDRCEYSVRVEL